MRVEAVSFDADGTLWGFTAVMRHALGATLRQLRQWYPGPATDPLTIEELIRIRERVASDHAADWSQLEDIRRAAFAATLEQLGKDTSRAAELNAIYLRHRFEDIQLFPDVLACLDGLPADLPVGLLSNGNSHPRRCGLAERLSFVVLAQEHGVAKPDRRLFQIAARQAGCSLEHLVHVGDSESDIVGARHAGCMSVLVNRSDELPTYAELADEVVGDLRDLPDLLVRLTS